MFIGCRKKISVKIRRLFIATFGRQQNPDQGDQIGPIYAYWATVFFG
jgi:hypothetical protein